MISDKILENFHNKNILITGGTGLIGVQLVKRLVELKSKVIVASLDKNIKLPKKKKVKLAMMHLNL